MRNETRSSAVLLALCACAACGTRQPQNEAPPPAPIAPQGGECAASASGENAPITTALIEASSPVVAFDGEMFRLAWWDMRGEFPAVSTVRVDRAGQKSGDSWAPSHVGAARDQTLAVDSAEANLVWLDEGTVKSTRLRGDGAPAEAPAQLADKATFAAAGARGAVAWVKQGVLYFRADGMIPPPDRRGRVPAFEPTPVFGGGIEDPRVAWNGAQYAVVWSSSVPGGRSIMLQRLSNKGVRLGKPMTVSHTAGVSRSPEIAAMGDGFAIVWTNAAPEEENPRDRYRIFFATVGEKGDAPRLTRQLGFNGSADHVAIAAAGTECGIAWVGSNDPQGSAVFFARLDGGGKPLGPTLHVSDGWPLTCGRPSLAYSGDGYGVAWHDDRNETGSMIVFSFVPCGPRGSENADAGAPPEAQGIVVDAPDAPAAAPADPPKPADSDSDAPKLKKLFQ
jgi:hypothetical protein